MKRTLTPEMMNALLDPSLNLDKDGKFSFVVPGNKKQEESREETALTVKMAEEAIRFLDLGWRGDPRSPEAKKRLQGWISNKKNTSGTRASKAKWNDPATRLLAVWNKINDRRTVLVDTSLLFNEGGAFPLGAVDVRYEKTAATKTQPEAERIVITRASNPSPEEEAKHEAKKKKKQEGKGRKKKK